MSTVGPPAVAAVANTAGGRSKTAGDACRPAAADAAADSAAAAAATFSRKGGSGVLLDLHTSEVNLLRREASGGGSPGGGGGGYMER